MGASLLDTEPDPRHPHLVHTVEPAEVMGTGGYSRPHTIHCGAEGIYVSALGSGSVDGNDGPAGIFTMDHSDFSATGQWELDRGSQSMAYDFWWHPEAAVLMSSEWGTPSIFESGIVERMDPTHRTGGSHPFPNTPRTGSGRPARGRYR